MMFQQLMEVFKESLREKLELTFLISCQLLCKTGMIVRLSVSESNINCQIETLFDHPRSTLSEAETFRLRSLMAMLQLEYH